MTVDKSGGLIAVAEAAKHGRDIWHELVAVNAEIEDGIRYRDSKGLRELAEQLKVLADWFDQRPEGGRPLPTPHG